MKNYQEEQQPLKPTCYDDSQKVYLKTQCQQFKQSTLICMNKFCQNSAFLCNQKQCKCYLAHKMCIKAEISSLSEAIQFKSQSLKSFQQKINQFFQLAIDKLSLFREQILLKHKQTFLLPALAKQQQIFLKLLNQQILTSFINEVTGKDVSQIYQKIHQKGRIQKFIQMQKLQLTHISQKFLSQINELSKNIYKVCNYLEDEFKIKINMEERIKLSKNGTNLSWLHFRKSSIVKTGDQEQAISKFFDQNIIKRATLLYKASQNQFSSIKFHELCDKIPNLLIFCQTQNGKKIGGYTCLPFDFSKKGTYSHDNDCKNFLFSLTHCQKLTIHQKQFAIYYEDDRQFALRFGNGSDLRISHQANNNQQSYAAIDYSYKHINYKQGSADSNRRFTGSDSIYFKMKQWEVWQIQI